jgi:hypothetical protein
MTIKTEAEFWFDPICPWAWITSRWILEVETVREIEVKWNIFSLGHLNRDKEVSEKYKSSLNNSWLCGRVVSAVVGKYGPDQVLPIYTAIGNRIHLAKEAINEDLFRFALTDIGLDATLSTEAYNLEWDEQIIASHQRGIGLVGDDVGTPIIAIAGVGFFGPVISPAPKGEEAGKLWDGVVLAASYPGFFEIKRSRTVGPIFN